MAVALILLLVAIGSVLFHLFSPWWWTPIATNWRYIDDTINITLANYRRVSARSSICSMSRGRLPSPIYAMRCRIVSAGRRCVQCSRD